MIKKKGNIRHRLLKHECLVDLLYVIYLFRTLTQEIDYFFCFNPENMHITSPTFPL